MMRRAIASGAPRLAGLSRRLLCADSSAAQPVVTSPTAASVANVSERPPSASVSETPVAAVADSHAVSPDASISEQVTADLASMQEPVEEASISADDGELEPIPSGEPASSRNRPRQSVNLAATVDDVVQHIRSLEKSSPRRAAQAFRYSMTKDDPQLLTKDVFWVAMPILARLSWGNTIEDALAFAKKHNIVLPTNVLNCALSGLMRNGKAQKAREIIDYMWTLPSQSAPNATSYNQLIGAHFYGGDIDAAYDVLIDMKNKMIYPTWSTYHTLIAGCIRRDAPRRAFETLLAVEQQRFKMSALTIGQMLVMCAEADDMAAVSQLLPRFEDALPRYAEEVERIAQRRTVYRSKADSPSSGAQATQESSRGEPRLEISGIMSLLRSAHRCSRPEIGEYAMSMFLKWYPDTPVPISAWYCLVSAYANCNKFAPAFDVLSRMRRSGVEPNLRDLNESLVRRLAADIGVVDEQYYRLVDVLRPEEGEARRASEAVAAGDTPTSAVVVEETQGDGVERKPQGEGTASPSAEATADESGEEAKPSFAETFLLRDANGSQFRTDDFFASDVTEQPGERTVGIAEFNVIIAACSQIGDLDRAFHTYDEAQRLGLQRNADTFNALIAGCIVDSHFVGGVRVAEEMKECGIALDCESIHLLVRLCVRCGKFNDAKQWLALAAEENLPVSTASFQTLARKLMRLGRLADLREVLAIGEQCGVSSTAALARVEGTFVKDIPAIAGDEPFLRRDAQIRNAPHRGGRGTDDRVANSSDHDIAS
jgi:pentatricopeptide repeat protein